MNIKKFLTVLVLGLAVFAVSCSNDTTDATTDNSANNGSSNDSSSDNGSSDDDNSNNNTTNPYDALFINNVSGKSIEANDLDYSSYGAQVTFPTDDTCLFRWTEDGVDPSDYETKTFNFVSASSALVATYKYYDSFDGSTCMLTITLSGFGEVTISEKWTTSTGQTSYEYDYKGSIS